MAKDRADYHIYIVCMDFSSCSIYDNSVKQIYVYKYMFIFDIVDFSEFIVSQ